MKTWPRLMVLAVLSTIALGGCTGDGGGNLTPSPSSGGSTKAAFEANGVFFSYPRDWKELSLEGFSAAIGSQLWGESAGIDKVNLVSVAAYPISVPITRKNIEEQKGPLKRQLVALFEQAGGSMKSGPEDTEMGGLPAIRFEGTLRSSNGTPVTSRLILAFDGLTEYFVNCQFEPSGEADVLAGCDRIVESFRLT